MHGLTSGYKASLQNRMEDRILSCSQTKPLTLASVSSEKQGDGGKQQEADALVGGLGPLGGTQFWAQ